MGQGKTLQAIALMLESADGGAALVVTPASVLGNWQGEVRRFAPSLNVLVCATSEAVQRAIKAGPGDVVLVTYGLLAANSRQIAGRTWQTAILDEAHAIKSRGTKMSQASRMIKAEARVLLTGTPLQNHVSELWPLIEFATPGLFGSYAAFCARFAVPIEKERDRPRQHLLRRLLAPFMLRRTKDDVLDELPEKTELDVRVDLSEPERALYESLRERACNQLQTGEVNTMQALAELTRLRLAACHPKLVDASLEYASTKSEVFMRIAGDLIQAGHRALVFSQFTSHLALIRAELDRAGIGYQYLDGATPAAERLESVERFNKGRTPLFLISLKAGGTGLNLTSADYVVHLDPWWNPAVEDQASDRAYRIGQTRPVTIYRLIAAGTIEEKILRLHASKKTMADALLEGTDMASRLGWEEILELLAAASAAD
ncbi:MAG: DEAD/DEAH box helicase [Duodenibacillus sp.]|nr:DEAD/DEAH box helicase [Duodenibacillus sp.]